jgi:hypothetical protein
MNMDECHRKHDSALVPAGDESEATVVAETKHKVDENDNNSHPAEAETAAAMADAKGEEVKMEEEIKKEDEDEGDATANRVSTYLVPLPYARSSFSHDDLSILNHLLIPLQSHAAESDQDSSDDPDEGAGEHAL